MKREIRVSELLSWKHCHRQHHFQYVENLEQLERPINFASGTAVHKTIEAVVRKETTLAASKGHAENYLREEFAGRDNIEGLIKKYLPGVINAVSKAPKFINEEGWHVEERLEYDAGDYIVVGHPDMYRVHNNTVDLVELKTTDSGPLDYLLFNPQHRYYGVMLRDKYPGHLVQFTYVCLPTQGKSSTIYSPWVFTLRAIDQAENEMLQVLGEIGKDSNPNYTKGCSYCDYNEICMSLITGSSGEGVKNEKFARRVS